MNNQEITDRLTFQSDLCYQALQRTMETLKVADAEFSGKLYRALHDDLLGLVEEEMGHLVQKEKPHPLMCNPENRNKVFHIPLLERDLALSQYGRSQFEPLILEWIIGDVISGAVHVFNDILDRDHQGNPTGLEYVPTDDHRRKQPRRAGRALYMTAEMIGQASKSFKDGSYVKHRKFGPVPEGSDSLEPVGAPMNTTYTHVLVGLGATLANLRGFEDCKEARQVIEMANMIPKIRELYRGE